VYLSQQSDTPIAGNVILRKVYYKDEFGSTDAFGTWTLIHAFADDTSYSDALTYINDTIIAGQTNGTAPASLVMTWEDASGFTGLLDDYPGAAAAYSLRLLDSTYTGSAIRVRRASDNAEQDIGFDNNELDTTALASFCSGTNGFVKTWYDQSGSANDATQATTANQPKIYDSVSGVETENGKPAIYKQSQAALLSFNSALVNGANFLYTIVHGPLSAFGRIADGVFMGPRTAINYRHDYDSGVVNQFNITTVDAITNQIILSSQRVATTSASLYTNGTITTNGVVTAGTDVSTTQTTIFSNNQNITAKIQEFIFYNSDQSINRTDIEDNINDFYSIY
jgi:hypothetical protein